MSFATTLKRVRQEKGMTQRQLAEAAGVGLTTITNWEQGLREPSLSMLQALCKSLDVKCEVFLDESAEGQEEETPKIGRPKKEPDPDEEAKPKRPRGRPKKAD